MARSILIALGITLTVLVFTSEAAQAAHSRGGQTTYNVNNYAPYFGNPQGVWFGTDLELGQSASTPGFIVHQSQYAGTGTVQALAAPSTTANGAGIAGWLILLGAIWYMQDRRRDVRIEGGLSNGGRI